MNATEFLTARPVRALFLTSACLAALAGCGGSGTNTVTGPGIRAVNGLSTVSQAAVMEGSYIIASALPYATGSGTPHTPYTIVPTGNQTISFATFANPGTILASTSVSVANSGVHYDEIAYNAAHPTVLTLLDEFSVPSTADVRFVNASATSGSVDMILTPPTGAPVKFTLAPGQVGPAQPVGSYGYQSFTTTGAYGFQVFPAGKDTGTPLLQQTINLTTGTSFSFILLDPQASGGPVIVLEVQDNQLYDTAV